MYVKKLANILQKKAWRDEHASKKQRLTLLVSETVCTSKRDGMFRRISMNASALNG